MLSWMGPWETGLPRAYWDVWHQTLNSVSNGGGGGDGGEGIRVGRGEKLELEFG